MHKEVQRFRGSEVQRFRGSRFKGSEVQRFRGSEVQRLKKMNIERIKRRTLNVQHRILGSPYKTVQVNNFNMLHAIASGSTC